MLFTIGYEKNSLPALADVLREAGVTRLIDVRAQPHSRRRAFAYKHLGPALAEYGIAYESWPVLGAPQAARDAAKAGDTVTFHQCYQAHLEIEPAREALKTLSALARTESPCILCYERDPRQCHRLLVGERVKAITGEDVQDLFA